MVKHGRASKLWKNMTRLERANYLRRFKAIHIKKGRPQSCDMKCGNDLKAGDAVYQNTNKEHVSHVPCVNRVIAQSKAAEGVSALAVLEERAAVSSGDVDKVEKIIDRKRGSRPEKLEIDIENIHIVITFKE